MGWFSRNDNTQTSTQFGSPTGMNAMGMGAGAAGMSMDPTMMMMQQTQNPMMTQSPQPHVCFNSTILLHSSSLRITSDC